jgi:hypothetical protein
MPAGVTSSRPLILLADQAWDAAGGGAVILRSLLGSAVGNGVIWVTAPTGAGSGPWLQWPQGGINPKAPGTLFVYTSRYSLSRLRPLSPKGADNRKVTLREIYDNAAADGFAE